MIDSHDYQVLLTGTGPMTGYLESVKDALPQLEVASPPEFGGPKGTWSPEHLFVASISACLMTTFHAIAHNSGLEILEYQDNATGHLQRGENRLFRIDRVTLRPRVVVADESSIPKATRLLEKAETACLIRRSVTSKVDLHPLIISSHPVDVGT
jgi:organic hydroperoxide reductase OsmC/OhrA